MEPGCYLQVLGLLSASGTGCYYSIFQPQRYLSSAVPTRNLKRKQQGQQQSLCDSPRNGRFPTVLLLCGTRINSSVTSLPFTATCWAAASPLSGAAASLACSSSHFTILMNRSSRPRRTLLLSDYGSGSKANGCC